MLISIRQMRSEDARAFLEVHHAAVREIAAKDYPSAVIEHWAPLPITDNAIERVRANPENDIRVLAEINGKVVGMGALMMARNELRACYVAPGAARKGVGSAVVRELERIAREHGLNWLELDASVTSEPFYAALGYEARGRGEHVLGSGQRMACVKMRKHFSPISSSGPRTRAVLGSALFLVAVPGVLAGLLPWWITHWEVRSPFLELELMRAIGVILILAGVPGLVGSFARFALQGLGTPAPIAPTRHLVVTGLYRFVRNPMYLAVSAVILGQALVLGDWRLVAYAGVFWFACHLFVVSYEEPTLQRTFGAEYKAFRANVPRWIPRLTPWRAE